MRNLWPLLKNTDFPSVYRSHLQTLQVNLGYRCNQRCLHCHVNAGPQRPEMMEPDTLAFIMPVLIAQKIPILDITGGAPELHPGFRSLVQAARQAGIQVLDRCNLTILLEPEQAGLADFLATHQVEIIASLPCYLQENVDQQRGDGVFARSVQALQQLNQLGYGQTGSGLILNLVYNPQGACLPPNQTALQADYQRELKQRYGIVFNQLFVLANMPINRFGSTLVSKGQWEPYIQLLKQHHCAGNLAQVMCRTLLSVDWQGYLYDCDFNQQLGLGLTNPHRLHLRDLLEPMTLEGQPIIVAEHCYGCTAGQGSSCGGAL